MAYKNVSLSLEAYERLKKLQKEDESFSQEVIRLTGTAKISSVAGILSEKEARGIERGIESIRKEAKVKTWS